MYKLTVIHAVYNVGADTDTLEFDMFDEMQDYIIDNDIQDYQIEEA
jgi:hypothetical protein